MNSDLLYVIYMLGKQDVTTTVISGWFTSEETNLRHGSKIK